METTVDNTELLSKIFTPDPIGNFFQPYEGTAEVQVIYYNSPSSPGETLTLENIYPFFTLDDLKLAIYHKKEEDPKFAPNYQFLATAVGQVEDGKHPNQLQPLQIKWIPILLTRKESSPEQYRLKDPLLLAEKGRRDDRFAESDGSRIELGYVNNAQVTLEDLFSKRSTFPPIYLYIFNDVYMTLKVQKPLSEKIYNGIMRPYFPFTDSQATGLVLSKEKKDAYRRIERKKGEVKESGLLPNLLLRQRLIGCLDTNLENEEYALAAASITGIKSLRVVFVKGSAQRVPLDTNFFSLKTSHIRPFLRYIPVMGTSVSKIQMKSSLPIPDIEDPSLLLDWGLEKSPTRERDFLMMKILIKQSFIQQPPLYATLRWLDDGTADILVKPPKTVKKLSPSIDLRDFQTNILQAIQDLPFATQPLQIQDSNFVVDIDLSREKARIDNAELLERARLLRGFFQELGRLEGESSDLNLRYRAVSNFVNEDRISNYLTQIASRPGLFEESVSVGEDIIELLMEEFQLSLEDAKTKAEKWFKDRAALYKADPDNNVFKLQNNPGIDISIYNKFPNFNIHIYRVDSYTNLRRVLLLLQIMLSWPVKVLSECVTGKQATQDKEEIDKEEEQLSADRESAAKEGDLGSSETEVTSSTENSGESIKIYGADDSDEEEEEEEKTKGSQLPVEQTYKPVAATTLPSGAIAPTSALPVATKDGKPCKSPQGTIKIANYFINHLYEADKALFGYAIGKKGMKPYTRACSATEDRMPAVMTPEQYQRMLDEYEQDIENEEISFIEYPLRPGEEEKTKEEIESSETYTVLRYGTDVANEHYYICCQYFCLKDTIMIREKDFLSTKDRQDPPQPKPARSCPFCCGKELKQFPDFAGEGETVFVRKNKPKYDIPHKYVGFYSKQIHPDPRNFGLPCCFTGPKAVKITDSAFRFRQQQDEPEDYRPHLADEEEEEEDYTVGDTITPNYVLLLQSVHRQYILGAEKMPLEIGKAPQIGLVPPALNDYFAQKSTDLVIKGGIRTVLKEDSEGFLRLGVQNQIQHNEEALFSAIAPFIPPFNTAKDVRQKLETVITPRVFVNLSYGNLLLEFYKPDAPDPNLVSPKRNFRDFVNELGVVEGDNSFVIKRAWKSYWAFKDFLADKREVKELRQFAPIFAEPRLITSRGIVFVVLEVSPSGELNVRCPPYGFSAEGMRGCDIGFLLHYGNIWEPILYTKNTKVKGSFAANNLAMLKWQMADYAKWPEIVQKRVNEFKTTCSGPGVGAYTSSIDTDSKTLLPFSKAIRILPSKIPLGIVRDIYNHLAAVTVTIEGLESQGQIAIPVVDDGLARTELRLYLGWDQYNPAPVDILVQYYKENLSDLLSLYEGYQVIKAIRDEDSKAIVAVQLANGIFLPAKNPFSEDAFAKLNVPVDTIPKEDFDWVINKQIYGETGEKTEEVGELDMEEVYQHLRLIFANWLVTPMGQEVKKFIQTLVNENDPYQRVLPIWEQRKRLEILIGPELMKWMDDEGEYPVPGPALLRKDCRVLASKDQCDGYCKWRGDDASGKCFLHVPKELQVNGKIVTSGKRMLYLRLFDEIIRYPKKREQLFNKSVSSLISLKKKLSIRDSTGTVIEEVYPEDSYDWFNLLRLEWTTKKREVSRWFEELTGTGAAKPKEVAKYQMGTTKPISESLQKFLSTGKLTGEEIDPSLADFQLFTVNPSLIEKGKEWLGILGYMGFNPSQIFKDKEMRSMLTGLQLRNFTSFTQKNVVQINLTAEDDKYKFNGRIFVPNPENETYIFIIEDNIPYYLSNKKQAIFAPLKDSMIPPALLDKILGLEKVTPPEKVSVLKK